MTRGALLVAGALAAALGAASACAEPYLAVRTGAKCVLCHVNPTGGGKRNEYGAIFGSTALAEGRLDPADDLAAKPGALEAGDLWTGRVHRNVSLGGDARIDYAAGSAPGQEDTREFRMKGAQLYFDLQLVPGRLGFYLDERVAPGSALSREAYAMLWSRERGAYVKVGRIFLPYGLRLEDDAAFVRQAPGINFTTSDDGVEGGLELGPASVALSVTNGNGGAAENNLGKRYSLLAAWVQPAWRLGASANLNQSPSGDRRMGNVFAGLRTGPIAWLAELDWILEEGTPGGTRRTSASLLEANLELARGHNLKLTAEAMDPDASVAGDERRRYSIVWEYVPFQHTQLRAGYRDQRGPAQNSAQNANELFAQWHLFF